MEQYSWTDPGEMVATVLAVQLIILAAYLPFLVAVLVVLPGKIPRRPWVAVLLAAYGYLTVVPVLMLTDWFMFGYDVIRVDYLLPAWIGSGLAVALRSSLEPGISPGRAAALGLVQLIVAGVYSCGPIPGAI